MSIPSTRVPLAWASQTLHTLMDAIDNASEIDGALTQAFADASTDVALAIDRRQAVIAMTRSYCELARSHKKDLDAQIKVLERIEEKITQSTKEAIEAAPGVVFKNSVGKKVSIARSSTPALTTTLNLGKTSVSNTLSTEDLMRVDKRFWSVVSFHQLNTSELKRALESGETVSWASLEYGSHLRGL